MLENQNVEIKCWDLKLTGHGVIIGVQAMACDMCKTSLVNDDIKVSSSITQYHTPFTLQTGYVYFWIYNHDDGMHFLST